jgi:hypoxanthine phosphoribosyltransferase
MARGTSRSRTHCKPMAWQSETVYGIPQGGAPLAVMVANYLGAELIQEPKIGMNTLVVDDLIDSGKTMEAISKTSGLMRHSVRAIRQNILRRMQSALMIGCRFRGRRTMVRLQMALCACLNTLARTQPVTV